MKITRSRQLIPFVLVGLVVCFFIAMLFLSNEPETKPQLFLYDVYAKAPAAPQAEETKTPVQPAPRAGELIYPHNVAVEKHAFAPRVGCERHNAFLGQHCHHFLYAKGNAPWTREELLEEPQYLADFMAHYTTGELRTNAGGQRLAHLFAVWSIARRFRPKFVIESGKFRGWGLYNLRRALGPDAVLFSLDPVDRANTYVDDNANTHYFGGTAPKRTHAHFRPFADIANVSWPALGVEPAHTLVILDDHASVPRRVAELAPMGFRRFYIDDNAPRPAGDSLCPKYLADPRPPLAADNWTIPILDNFGVLQRRADYAELLRMGEAFFAQVRTYYEFPPLVLHDDFFRKRAKDFRASSPQEIWEMTPEPLLPFHSDVFRDLDLTYEETNYYYCAFLELQ